MSDPAVEERLRSLLTAAAAPTEPGELPGERQALADFRAAVHDRSRRSLMRSRTTPIKAAAVVCAGVGALLVGGTAAAATGVLPDAAQDTAREMLEKVGVTVPGADDHSAGHADQRGSSEEPAATTSEGQGNEISELARGTDPGPDHGPTVSEEASSKADGPESDDSEAELDSEAESLEPESKGAEISQRARDASTEDGKGEEVAPVASDDKAGGAAADTHGPGTSTEPDTETDTSTKRGGTAEQHSDGAGDRGAQQAGAAGGGRSTSGTDHRP